MGYTGAGYNECSKCKALYIGVECPKCKTPRKA